MGTAKPNATKPKLLLFDVYETLLDMSELEKKVNSLLNSKRGFIIWFELLLQYSFADNCTGQFHSFTDISKATMEMVAKALGEKIKPEKQDDVIELMKQLPLHDGAQNALSMFHDQGFRLAALTNTPKTMLNDRMERSGLISYFEMVLSAEEIKKYKPSKDVYLWAAKNVQVQCSEVMMVSAHGWDIAGSANAGMQTAYVTTIDPMLYPLAPQPSFIAKDLSDLANQLSSHYS